MHSITLTLPIPVVIDVKLTARHKAKAEPFYFNHNVDVLTLELAEAPLAAVYKKFGAPKGQASVHVHGNTFYMPIFHEPRDEVRNGRLPVATVSLETLQSSVERMRAPGMDLFPAEAVFVANAFRDGHLKQFNPEEFHSFDPAAIETAISVVQQNIADIIVIDGLVCKRVPEPVYKVNPPTGFTDGEPYLTIVPEGTAKDKSATNEFSLTAFDDASDYAQRYYGTGFAQTEAATILVPEAFRFDRTVDAVLDFLVDAVEEHASHLRHTDIETLTRWAKFRDAVDEALGARSPQSVDRALQAFSAEYKSCPAPRSRSIDLGERALERWNTRPITILNQIPQGLKP